jgi:hypothetical protein
MSQMCWQKCCTRKLDEVANFYDNDPDAVVKSGDIGLTQRTADFYETLVKSYVQSAVVTSGSCRHASRKQVAL